MKVWLLYRDRDFDAQAALPPQAEEVAQDLQLQPLFGAMAGGDAFLSEVARRVVLGSLEDPAAITYRQQILDDCLHNQAAVRELYALAIEAIEREKKAWGWLLSRYPEGVLSRSIETLRQLSSLLAALRQLALAQRDRFQSEGWRRLLASLTGELRDEYLHEIDGHVQRLAFRDGLLIRAQLGSGNRGQDYVLCEPPAGSGGWAEWLQGVRERYLGNEPSSYAYEVAERDEAGLRALSELRGQGISAVAAALGRSTDHLLGFFTQLRTELAFYLGCLNLHARLMQWHAAICVPLPVVRTPLPTEAALSAEGVYDVALSLQMTAALVGNRVEADGKGLVLITGANRGGKSTLLRALGQAQLMMQAGMFVAAQSLRASVCRGLFTHFKREEDPKLRQGKFDEELGRMSAIVDCLQRGCLLLLNESFASTNEREGSEIAREIVGALLESGVRVLYVTHLYDLAEGFSRSGSGSVLFLRAERLSDGQRTFRVLPGEPSPTSYGEDLYRRIFGADSEAAAAGAARRTA